jgi:ABC-type Mn2+/Zn2+ transport system ATPase subunit
MSASSHNCCAHHSHHHELAVEQLGVRYRHIPALDDVSFATSCGSCVALIGPNGAGKSTLLRAIAGLVKPATGRVRWRGTTVARWSREIAYLPQRENVDWHFPITVERVVAMGRYPQTGWWRPFRADDTKAVSRALETMDLAGLHNRQISELSGGQQQRVFLARALAQEAHVLLLDEPFTGLDRNSKASLASTLRSLAKEGRLVIASHHDLETVRDIYDEVLLLHQRQIAFGTVDETFTEPLIAKTFAGKEEECPTG